MASFDSSADLFDDSFDEEDYLTALSINEATNDSNENEQSMHMGPDASVMRNDTINLTESFICPFCESNEDSIYSLEIHIAIAHPEMTVDENNARPNSHRKSLRFEHSDDPYGDDHDGHSLLLCPYCDMRLESEFNLSEHIDSVHKEELLSPLPSSSEAVECPVCNEAFSSGTELEHHVQWHFSTSDSYNSPRGSFRSSRSDETSLSKCPVCEFRNEDYAILTSHVESHFDPHHAPGPSKTSNQLSPSGSASSSSHNGRNSYGQRKQQARGRNVYQNQYRKNLEKSVVNGHISPGEYHERMAEMKRSHQLGIDEGRSKVEGIYENLAKAYQRLDRHGQRVTLCDPTDYYCGSYGDKGWGCGFRNFQMMISCLARIPMYAEKLFPDGDIQVPSVCKLQQIIEGAWRKGFDREGCTQLGGKLVNTRKWIGATEVVATLASMGIKCTLADFHRSTAADGSHPRLLEWVYDYFLQDSQHKPPLYLQHQGHSRTIAGIENDNGVLKLVMFDPGTPYHRVAHLSHKAIDPKQLRTFRRTVAAFKAKQYQIVAVTGILTPYEYEENKILQSIQVS